jgi:hypothetical protein
MTTTDLTIMTNPVDATKTTVVQMNTLQMNPCTRLIVNGMGKVDLRIGAATGNDLYVQGPSGGADNGTRFGVTPLDKPNKSAPVQPGQLTVWMYSSCLPPGCTCQINNGPSCAGLVSHTSGEATFMAPEGRLPSTTRNLSMAPSSPTNSTTPARTATTSTRQVSRIRSATSTP